MKIPEHIFINNMIRRINRITRERTYWKDKCIALEDNKPFEEIEKYEKRNKNLNYDTGN